MPNLRLLPRRFQPTLSLLAASFFFARAAAAQPAAASEARYTLAQLVELALRDAPLLDARSAAAESKELSAAQARVWQGPSADVTAGRRSEGPDGGPRYELQLSQPLPWTRKPALRGDILAIEAQAEQAKRDGARVQVTLAVAQGAFEYAASRRKAAFADSRRKRFELIGSYLAGRVFPTPQRKAESRIVANRLVNLAAEAIESQAAYQAALEKLRVYVPLEPGRSPEVEVPWLGGGRPFTLAALLETAVRDNPDLRVQRFAAEASSREFTLARREGLPDAAVLGTYEQGKAAQLEKNYGLGLSLSFPSWNANRAGVRSAEKRRLAEERSLAFEERRLRAELSRAVAEYEAARQVVLKYPPEILERLEEDLSDADKGFRKGQIDLLTFLELDGSVAETYGRVLDAQAQLAVKAAEVLSLTAAPDALRQLGAL